MTNRRLSIAGFAVFATSFNFVLWVETDYLLAALAFSMQLTGFWLGHAYGYASAKSRYKTWR